MSRKDGKRPDGLTLLPYKQGKCLVWDATVVDNMAISYIDQASKRSGEAAARAEREKSDLYQELKKEYMFVPVAIETMGAWGQMGLKFFKEVGSKIQDVTREKKSSFYLFQRISIAIQRGNAACIPGTSGPSVKLDEMFYL